MSEEVTKHNGNKASPVHLTFTSKLAE